MGQLICSQREDTRCNRLCAGQLRGQHRDDPKVLEKECTLLGWHCKEIVH